MDFELFFEKINLISRPLYINFELKIHDFELILPDFSRFQAEIPQFKPKMGLNCENEMLFVDLASSKNLDFELFEL